MKDEAMRRGPEPQETGPMSDGGLTGDIKATTGRDLPNKPETLQKDDSGKGKK